MRTSQMPTSLSGNMAVRGPFRLFCLVLTVWVAAGGDLECSSRDGILDVAPIIDEVHALVGARPARGGRGPLVVGGVPGSGTRAVIELFHTLGVHAVGDSRWDSHFCLIGTTLTCGRSLDYSVSDFDEHMRAAQASGLNADTERYVSQHPFAGHCYGGQGDNRKCTCGCHEEEAPLAPVVAAGLPWGFKQPECYMYVPFLQAHFPNHTFILVVRDGKDAPFSMSSRDQLNCRHEDPFTPTRVVERWAEANTQVVEWAKKHAYGDAFFVVRTEDVVDSAADPHLVPVLLRALASVGLGNKTAAEVVTALEHVRHTSLGSDTGGLGPGSVREQWRGVYGKWRKHKGELEGLSATARAALLQFGYLDQGA